MISDLILIAKKFSVPSAYGRRDGVRDFFAQYHEGVYIATDSGAPAGWEGYAVWFGGTGERYAERFMEFIRDGYIVERFLRARVGGLLVFTFRCRLKMRRFGTLGKPYGGASPLDKWWGLKLTIPNGGNVILRKYGSPTAVNLEVSTDAVHWSAWELVGTDYTYALSAGQTLCIRNASETATSFSIGDNNYYYFILDEETHASGSVNSLIIKHSDDVPLSSYCFRGLFRSCQKLKTPPYLQSTRTGTNCYKSMFIGSGITTPPVMDAIYPASSCCRSMFENCTSLTESPIIRFIEIISSSEALRWMFYGCSSLKKITIYSTKLSANNCTTAWTSGVHSNGDFYCPASLTLPVGNSGIPSSWTRHDI